MLADLLTERRYRRQRPGHRPRWLPAMLLAVLAPAADAALIAVAPVEAWTYYGGVSSRRYDLSTSTATFVFDTSSTKLTQTGGTFNITLRLTPASIVWTHSMTGLVWSQSEATADSFTCIEGNYGVYENTNFCGGYEFGDNFIDESVATWGPGTAYSRSIGGDDTAPYGQWSLLAYYGFTSLGWDGTTLLWGNGSCLIGTCSPRNGRLFTFQVVPAPASLWLLGWAMGLLGAFRMRRT